MNTQLKQLILMSIPSFFLNRSGVTRRMQKSQALHGLSVISSSVCRDRRKKGSLYAFLLLFVIAAFLFNFFPSIFLFNILLCFSLNIPAMLNIFLHFSIKTFNSQLLQKLQNDLWPITTLKQCAFYVVVAVVVPYFPSEWECTLHHSHHHVCHAKYSTF